MRHVHHACHWGRHGKWWISQTRPHDESVMAIPQEQEIRAVRGIHTLGEFAASGVERTGALAGDA